VDDVLHALTDAAVDVLEADRSAALMFDETTRELRVRATSGLSQAEVQALIASLNGLDTTTIEKLDVPRVVPDTSRDSLLVRNAVEAVGVSSVIDVPITIAGKRFGLFSMGWVQHHDITPDEVRMAAAIGQRAAVAIENARLYERAQHAASLEERQRLARELHDSVSQALYGISLGTRTARTLLERDPSRVGEPLEYVSGLAELAWPSSERSSSSSGPNRSKRKAWLRLSRSSLRRCTPPWNRHGDAPRWRTRPAPGPEGSALPDRAGGHAQYGEARPRHPRMGHSWNSRRARDP